MWIDVGAGILKRDPEADPTVCLNVEIPKAHGLHSDVGPAASIILSDDYALRECTPDFLDSRANFRRQAEFPPRERCGE